MIDIPQSTPACDASGEVGSEGEQRAASSERESGRLENRGLNGGLGGTHWKWKHLRVRGCLVPGIFFKSLELFSI